ncbi:MAG: DUF4163 domain-containing protein [Lachnospiraceae bacterium]|nr:DUF4163 domain-containing protein [Lachnospiraceae bacterium]
MKKSGLGRVLFLIVLVVMAAGVGMALGMAGESGEKSTSQEPEPLPEVREINESEETEKETPFDMATPIPDEVYTTIVSYEAKKLLQSENGLAKAEITVTMPQLTMRSAVAGKINEQLLDFYTGAYENGLSAGGEDMEFQQETSEEAGEDFYYRYSYEEGYQVTLFDERYLSILAEGYEYAGGAHGMPFRIPLIFDLETGEQVKGKSLFAVSEEQFMERKREAYRELIAQSDEGTYWEDALSLVEESTDFDSGYYLSENGVTFYYAPYALAPYAAGFVEATVPYEKLPLVGE